MSLATQFHVMATRSQPSYIAGIWVWEGEIAPNSNIDEVITIVLPGASRVKPVSFQTTDLDGYSYVIELVEIYIECITSRDYTVSIHNSEDVENNLFTSMRFENVDTYLREPNLNRIIRNFETPSSNPNIHVFIQNNDNVNTIEEVIVELVYKQLHDTPYNIAVED